MSKISLAPTPEPTGEPSSEPEPTSEPASEPEPNSKGKLSSSHFCI